ncbi:uncharacterized protein F5147DRAFT_654848 [Suillus discolor]|uniref:Uncharacterized protein n=1 Tax=Suillus discolor TaxID=1912936 RepID=A0A9P7F2U5_9AGAM|nr:uncharacterized protein F5147DRAFT_654848 [Suillus discolor]KAG2103114.1 hypothetical protein F5147DRAFT_654848 [Suillus discolor]
MSDELLVKCSIHLDGVPLKDTVIQVRTRLLQHMHRKPFPSRTSAFQMSCRKHIQRKDAFQIFLNPHQSLTQPGTQSPRRDSGVDIDFTLSDDADSTIERVSSLRKKTPTLG